MMFAQILRQPLGAEILSGPSLWWLAFAAAILVSLLLVIRYSATFYRFHGTRVVRCPENGVHVAVHVDNTHAAATGLHGGPDLRLDSCTRWPQMRHCGQECLRQIADAPEDCLIRNIAARWYCGKQCRMCGRVVGDFQWPDFRCGLRLADGRTVEWRDLPAQTLPAALETAEPVCWNCHIAETFRRAHPELVVDRPGDIVGPLGERSDSPKT
jgi:hypothetical protein